MQEKEEVKITKSQAKKIREVIQMHKKLLGRKQKLTEFKEPIALLIRRSHDIEFYENATKGKFAYRHTDGDMRTIDLIPSKLMSFPYSDRRVRTYILHEDSPLPLPEDPTVSSELITISQEKSMHDLNKYRTKMEEVKGANLKIILWGIAGIIIALVLGVTVIPQSFWDSLLKKGVEKVAENVSQKTTAERPLLGSFIIGINFLVKKWKAKNQQN